MARLTGKVAVVTGASKGIGASIAKAFGKEGAKVVVNYASAKADAENVVAAIKQAGGEAIAVQGDVSKKQDVQRIFAETKKAFGGVDVLVNNAGVYEFKPLGEITEEHFHKQYDINVLGTLLATQEAVKHTNGSGASVINLSSVVSLTPAPTGSVYSGTKAAIDAVTRSLALELAPQGIRVNSLAPGLVITEGTKASGNAEGDFLNWAVSRTPLGRPGQPDDIADAAVFLASNDSRWVTGEVLPVAGGARL